ncbi:MAG: signal peptidase II [bacterium]
MQRNQKFYLMLLVLISCLGCDQISKRVAKQALAQSPPRTYLWETFRLQYAENSGAFLSLGSGLPKDLRTWLFTIISGGLLVALFVYIFYARELDKNHIFALSLILGGGTSNLFDRIINDGKVIDFMNMGIGGLRTGIFNWADVVIMVGMGLIILLNLSARKKMQEDDAGNNKDDMSIKT